MGVESLGKRGKESSPNNEDPSLLYVDRYSGIKIGRVPTVAVTTGGQL